MSLTVFNANMNRYFNVRENENWHLADSHPLAQRNPIHGGRCEVFYNLIDLLEEPAAHVHILSSGIILSSIRHKLGGKTLFQYKRVLNFPYTSIERLTFVTRHKV